MSIDRRMDKEDVVNIYNRILLTIKRNEILPTAKMQMGLEITIQSEVSQKNKYHKLMHICGIQKNGIDDLICKAEIETQTQRTNIWISVGKGGYWEVGIDIYTLLILCIKQLTNEKLLYSTGNYTQCSVT